jgi:hypothetical protein
MGSRVNRPKPVLWDGLPVDFPSVRFKRTLSACAADESRAVRELRRNFFDSLLDENFFNGNSGAPAEKES